MNVARITVSSFSGRLRGEVFRTPQLMGTFRTDTYFPVMATPGMRARARIVTKVKRTPDSRIKQEPVVQEG